MTAERTATGVQTHTLMHPRHGHECACDRMGGKRQLQEVAAPTVRMRSKECTLFAQWQSSAIVCLVSSCCDTCANASLLLHRWLWSHVQRRQRGMRTLHRPGPCIDSHHLQSNTHISARKGHTTLLSMHILHIATVIEIVSVALQCWGYRNHSRRAEQRRTCETS